MVAVAEKVTKVPLQTGLLDGEIKTLTGRLALTLIVIEFDVAGLPVAQVALEVKIQNMWGLCESQETVGVSPAMFEEFVFQYQVPVISRFGLSYYGCCEPVHNRIHIIKRLPNLRSLSVSPWCNQEILARELGANYIFCRKPSPTLISTDHFDEDAIRADIRATVRAAGGLCPLEFAMKDVHTLKGQPKRLGRWVQLAREEAA